MGPLPQLNTNQSIQIETQYIVFQVDDEITPFESLVLKDNDSDKKFKISFDIDLVNIKRDNEKIVILDNSNLIEETANLKENLGAALLAYPLNHFYEDLLIDEKNCVVNYCNTSTMKDLLSNNNLNITLSKVDINKDYAIKFKLRIERIN